MQLLNKDLILDKFLMEAKKGLVLMLDYDGTLSPFVEDRMQARFYPGIKERLLNLSKIKGNSIIIISGRSLSDLEKLDIPLEFELWGSHGIERKQPFRSLETKITFNSLHKEGLELGLQACLDIEKEYCEIKPFSIAFHWRGMETDKREVLRKRVEDAWKVITKNYELEILHFDGGMELRIKNHHKGKAVEQIISETSIDKAIAYIGDDVTDEDAFASLGNRGLKILVGDRQETLADILLSPQEDIKHFLDMLWGNQNG